MRTIVYIDGFNLYYGCVKGTPYKWLDLVALSRRLLPRNEIVEVNYFTAKVSATTPEDGAAIRQEVFLRALRTCEPLLQIYYGHFIAKTKTRPLANPPRRGAKYVEVLDREEKGSDVNLATRLLVDGFDGRYECAAVITNDSDLAMPIKIVRSKLRKPVVVLNSSRRPRNTQLSPLSLRPPNAYLEIRPKDLRVCQFPDTLTDANGRQLTKPAAWYAEEGVKRS